MVPLITYVKHLNKHYPRQIGVIVAGIAALALSFIGFTIKLVDHSIPMLWIAIFRFLIMALCFLPFMLFNKQNSFRIKRPILFLLRCLFGFLGMLLFFNLSRDATLNEASLFMNTTPIYVAVLSYLFLNTKIKASMLIGIIISLLGIVVIYYPSGELYSATLMMGIALGLVGGCAITLLKPLLALNSSVSIAFYLTVTASIITLCFIPFFPMPHFSLYTVLILIASAACGMTFQVCLNYSTKLLGPIIVSEMLLASVIFSGLLDVIVWQFIPTWLYIAGVIIVISGIVIVISRHRD